MQINIVEVLANFSSKEVGLGLSLLIGTLILLSFSEKLNENVKSAYTEKFGPESWNLVFRNSLISGFSVGFVSGIGGKMGQQGDLFYYLIPFGAVIGYIGMQSIITDPPLHKVDRFMLRIGYSITFALTFIYLTQTYPKWSALQIYLVPVVVTYFILFILFLFSRIGASDIRAIVVFLPFIEAISMPVGLGSFVVVGVLTAAFMLFKKVQLENPMYAVPILPVLVAPYMIIVPLLPIIIDYYTLLSI